MPTETVREAVVSRPAAGAVPADDVGFAATLAAKRLTREARRTVRVTVAREGAIVVL